MYPQSELNRLAAHKLVVRRRIAVRRVDCTVAATEAIRPLEWMDRAIALVRQLSPLARFAAVPLGFLLQRTLFPRKKLLGSMLRWAPLVIGAVRGIGAALGDRASASGRR